MVLRIMIKKNLRNAKSVLGLSYSIAKADFKMRNEGSYLGIFWYLLTPLAMFLIILFVRGAINSSSTSDYPVYLLIGLIMFNYFRATTSTSITDISGNSNYVKSMKISYESLVCSRIIQSVFSHIFEVVLIIVFMIFFRESLFGLLFYPFLFLFFVLFILGLSFLLSTIGTFINDLSNVWSVLMQFLFFATPIFYAANPGDSVYLANLFNPMFYFLSIARDMIIYRTLPETWMTAIMILFSLVTFLIGFIVFEKNKSKFAERV